MIKQALIKMYASAGKLNNALVLKSIKQAGPLDSILDVGCWDGKLTIEYAEICEAKKLYGIEIVPEMRDRAKEQGIECFALRADRDPWPFKDESIDCIVSNQVIEHLSDVDHFFREASRVLRKGGVVITSTNNLSSWHNIISLFFGWAPFDLTNGSIKQLGIGNPLSAHRGEPSILPTWTHKCIYTSRWLFEWQRLYGLKKINLFGAGLYPLPAKFGNIFKKHAAFMILTTKK